MAFNYRAGDEPVPGYRLVRFLGKGAIGEVWQATGPGGTEAALKMVDLTGSAAHARKEFRALQLVKRIHHPNLAPIIAFWAKNEDGSLLEDSASVQLESSLRQTPSASLQETMMAPAELSGPRPKELIIAMGLGRQSLADRLGECQQQGLEGIPVDELLGYMEDSAKAIDFLNSPIHQLESGVGAIGHCDIKPLNILIVGGAVQVCDFGLAHIVGAARSTAAAMGTIAYVAPELLEGKPSPATDQYCLAITYFELRTGALPYDKETAGAVMKAVLDGALNFSKLPEAEQAVIRKAASKNPGDRFPSALEMVAALREAAIPGTRPASKTSRRLTLLNALVGIVCIGAVAFLVWTAINRGKEGDGIPPPPITKPVDLVQQGSDALGKGDLPAAVKAYDEVLAADPTNRRALIGRARCALKLKKFDEVVALVLKVQPRDPETTNFFVGELSRAGDEFMKSNSWDLARDVFSRALELDPRNAMLCVQVGRACLQQDLPDDAIVHFNGAIQLDPQSADAYLYRGRAYLKKRLYDKALADFEYLMQKIDPDNRLGYGSRKEYGEVYLEQGTAVRDQGKELLIAAAKSTDEKGRAAKEAQAREKIQAAVELFSKGVRHDPNSALLFSRRGTSLLQLGKTDQAVEDLTSAIKLDTEGADMDLVYRGSTYVKMATLQPSGSAARKELLEKAKADYRAAGKKNPKNADADYLLAECYLQLGDYKAAIGPYDDAIKKLPHWPNAWFTVKDAYFYQGNCCLANGDLQRAAGDFSQFLKLTGDSVAGPAETARTLHALAAEFAKLKQLKEASQWNEKAIGLAPDQAVKEQYREAEKAWKGKEL
jgi:tetratricopeptide (TPR) repeat protein/serine/threonine protein kinase